MDEAKINQDFNEFVFLNRGILVEVIQYYPVEFSRKILVADQLIIAYVGSLLEHDDRSPGTPLDVPSSDRPARVAELRHLGRRVVTRLVNRR